MTNSDEISTISLSNLDSGLPVGYSYGYDQLNRLTGMRQHNIASGQSSWSNSNIINDYKENIAYDANGNILKYLRNGTTQGGSPLGMDSLTYLYNSNTNQLNTIHDSIPVGNYANDLDNQNANNYAYDSIGNLIKDNATGISNIIWSVYGKPTQIAKSSNNISFGYDAGGNRILKNATGNKQYYIRDAQGNILSIYNYDGTSLKWSEQDLYGSNRIGTWDWDTSLPTRVMLPQSETDTLSDWYLLGSRNYELSNYLGNILSVISDKKIGVSSGGSIVDYYKAEVLSQNDYYPFGMEEPGRSFNANVYPYAFNGKRMEQAGAYISDAYDYGMRMYYAKVGRFFSVDPLTEKYPWYTPYQFAGNKPIWATDVDGLEENTLSTYVYHPPILSFKPSFRGVISISDAMSQTVHKTFQGNFGKLTKADPSGRSTSIVNALIGSNIGTAASRLNITMIGTRSQINKTWKGTDMKYFTQYSYTFTNNNVTEIGTFEVNNASMKASARAWDPLAFLLVNKVVGSVIGVFGSGAEKVTITNMESFMESATTESKNGLTVVGRALQKHAGREGSSFADINFSGKTGNQQGLDVLNEILSAKSQTIERLKNGTTNIFDESTGRGVNVSRTGLFNGFRDLKMK